MRILAIHNYHRVGSASGDDQVFKSEVNLLRKKGHIVEIYTVINDTFDKSGVVGKVFSTLGMFWSVRNYRNVKRLCSEFKPEIVHVHTFFPLLSPSVLYAAKRSGCKVVATLHDTRFVCPCATSLRQGQICNLCNDGRYFRMVKHKCFKNSGLMSMIVALVFSYHRLRKSFYLMIDKYICLNENQILLLKETGFDVSRVVKKYNFVPDSKMSSLDTDKVSGLPDRYVVFYGRIGEEKGIRNLMLIWNQLRDIPLVVMGSGPLENEFSEWASKHSQVIYKGYTQHEECLKIVSNCEFVVFPSIWYEGCSMVEVETESLGKCIIATDLGFSHEAIEDGKNGFKVPLGDIEGFVNKIRFLWERPELITRMGNNARNDYQEKYTTEDNYRQLLAIYESI